MVAKGGKIPASGMVKSRNGPEGISLRNINNQQYVGEVLVGQPQQLMTVMFDTGSSIMYVLSTKCQKGCPGRLEKFDAEQSSTFEDFRAQRQEQAYG